VVSMHDHSPNPRASALTSAGSPAARNAFQDSLAHLLTAAIDSMEEAIWQ
jgi:hypothetical protein